MQDRYDPMGDHVITSVRGLGEGDRQLYWHSDIIIFYLNEIIAENWFNTKEKPSREEQGKKVVFNI